MRLLWCVLCLFSLSFPFYFYGEPYSTLYLGNNGNLHFGTPSQSDLYDWLPISVFEENPLLPIFSPFNAQYNLLNNGNVSWSLETVAPGQRAIVIRYSNIAYLEDSYYGNNDMFSMDVLLYESPVGQIDVRYYRIDVDESGTTSYQIGMQSNEGLLGAAGGPQGNGYSGYGGYYSSYFVPYDELPVDATAQSTLQGTVLTFNFTGIVDNSSSACGGLGYDFRNISQSDLSYWDQAEGWLYYVRLCSAVSQPVCAASLAPQGYRAMICQAQASKQGVPDNFTFPLAVYNPNAIYWQYLINGVRATLQDGLKCSIVRGQPRVSIINFICDPTAVTANITSFSENPSCTYNFNINTNLACGNGSRTNQQGAVPSTLPTCQSITGVGYSATWCPRALTSPAAVVPQTLPNLVVDSNLASDDAYDTITIGFNVNLYGTNYSVLAIDSNGLITFGPVPTSSFSPGSFPDLGLGSTANYFPLIAPLWVDMVDYYYQYDPSVFNGFIGYSLEGTAPNRQFFVRFSNVEYYASFDSAEPGTCTFDVVFYENCTTIQTIYYYIAPNPTSFAPFVVGMHGQNASVYTAVQNAPLLTVDVAARLSYSTITYSYSGPSEAAVCGAGVFPQLASIPDLNLTSGNNTYWLKPCGVTSTSACVSGGLATQAASVCAVQGNRLSSLATDNPTATQWYLTSNTSARSITQDGASTASCRQTPIVTVDYVCLANASSAVLSSVAVSGCTYNFVVNTNLLCSAPPSSTPSSSSSSSAVPSTSSSGTSASPSSVSSSAVSSSAVASASSSAASAPTRPSSSSTSSPASPTSTPVPSSSPSPSSTSPGSVTSVAQPTSSVAQPTSAGVAAASSSSSSSSSSSAAAAGSVSNSGGGGSSSLSGGAIAGIVIGTVAGVALLCLLLVFLLGRNSKNGSKRMTETSDFNTQPESDTTDEVELQHVEP